MQQEIKKAPCMLPIKEVSKRTGISYDWIRKLCLRKEIAFIKCGAKYLINYDKFVDYLNGDQSEGWAVFTNDRKEKRAFS